jgi:hypothetical protein
MHIRTQSGKFIVFTPNSELYVDQVMNVCFIFSSVYVDEPSGLFLVVSKTGLKLDYISGTTTSREVAQTLVDQIMEAYFNNLKIFKPDYSKFEAKA